MRQRSNFGFHMRLASAQKTDESRTILFCTCDLDCRVTHAVSKCCLPTRSIVRVHFHIGLCVVNALHIPPTRCQELSFYLLWWEQLKRGRCFCLLSVRPPGVVDVASLLAIEPCVVGIIKAGYAWLLGLAFACHCVA